MKGFVNNFKDNRISIETLKRMLNVDYQKDTLLELAIVKYQPQNFEIIICSKFHLKLENSESSIFILLSSNEQTLDLVKNQTKSNKLKNTIIVFDPTEQYDVLENKVVVKTSEWMNRIISHGINRQILDLQYLRDMDYHYA